ncbi:hypothetical protein CPB83DRAFT_840455 [Crepidotus variabilis]|uniref:Uncharacterized protein n=1 Tax=Crepidotus variabilis TaxID=179855 RepID=A0A9P6JIP7_9AGAR|nr:hypothetical protein CPB83DRAFT_840455 [Crepidotus variabilis]
MSTQTPSEVDPNRPLLPQVCRRAYWHNESGLIVTVFNRPLPLEIVEGPPRNDHQDLYKEIYYGFYPRRPIASSTLFEVLNFNDEAIAEKIVRRSTGWGLDLDLRASWSNLETLLVAVMRTLIDYHPDFPYFPILSYPLMPADYGYTSDSLSQSSALHVAKKSKQAFSILTGLVTFALSLWLTSYADSAFDDAFALLSKQPWMSNATLAHLKNLIVNMGPERLFGLDTASATARRYYFPPQAQIEKAKRQSVAYDLPPLPLPILSPRSK